MREEATAVAPPVDPTRSVRPPRRTFHGGWAMMIAAGVLAAAANLMVLGSSTVSTDVLVVDGTVPPGTPAGQLATRIDTMSIDDASAWGLVEPAALAAMGDMVTTATMTAGDLLRASDLRQPTPADGTAMSIPIDSSRAVGGVLSAGDQVGVIAELDGQVAMVVRAATVLDVAVPGSTLGAPAGGHSITLQVTEEQALLLSRAMRTSELDVIRTSRGN